MSTLSVESIKTYTYEQYCALYEALGGITTHYVPVVGTRGWHKEKLSPEEFEHGLTRLREIKSHDSDWLFANHPNNYIDVFEDECWQAFHLRSLLFVIELERHESIAQALQGD